MRYLIDRLSEASTYAGIAAILASFGWFGLSVGDWNVVLGAVSAVFGAISIFVKEKGTA